MKFFDVVNRLRNAGAADPVADAAYLVSHVCGLDRDRLLMRLDDPELDSCALEDAVAGRESGYPLQYILGEWEFYGLPFTVKEGCLIPRSDTEILVEKAISLIPRGVCFADVCCGSGCIAVSILKHRPDLRAVAVDLYDTPLELTSENARLNGVSDRLSVVRCDVLGEAEKLCKILSGCRILISNPPYIPKKDMDLLDRELFHEPRSALCGGEDGMDFYRVLTDVSSSLGIDALFEIGYDQGEAITALSSERKRECSVYKDYSANDRVAFVRAMAEK